MKKLSLFFIAMIAVFGSAIAALPITKVDRVNPTDDLFMEMAIDEAKKSVADGGLPCGAAIIQNNRMLSVGQATEKATAEEAAIALSRKKKLSFATIYTINEPITEAYIAICRTGAESIVFVNDRDAVIDKGVYPAEAYNDSLIDSTVTKIPMHKISSSDAEKLLQNYKK